MAEAWDAGIALGAFGDGDLGRLASDGSSPFSIADALRAATRARLLHVAIGTSHGREVEAGLARADAEAALRLASTPAVDLATFDAKSLLLRGGAADAAEDLVEAMNRTALDHDGRRLGVRRRPPACGDGRAALIESRSRSR